MFRLLPLTLLPLFFSVVLHAQEPKLILPIGHTLGVGSAIFSPDGKRIVTSALDNTAKIWDIETGRLLANLTGHTDTLFMATYSPDGKKIASSAQDKIVKIWDANSALLLADLIGHTAEVYAVDFSPDGKKIVSSSADATVKIWDVASGKLLADLKGHTMPVWFARFSPDGKKIYSGSEDSTAKIWDAASGKLLADLRGHRFEVMSIDYNPNGKMVITGAGDSTAKLWDAMSGRLLRDIRDHGAPLGIVQFSYDGKKFVTASDDGEVRLWDTETGNLISLVQKKLIKPQAANYYPDICRAADFSPDGKKLITIYRDQGTKIWDGNTGRFIVEIVRENMYVNSSFFSKDGKKYSLALASGITQLYDVENGRLIIELKGGAKYIASFEYSPDGKRILVRSQDGASKILDAQTGSVVINLPVSESSRFGGFAIFSPNGKKVVSTDGGNKAAVYDALSGNTLFELTGHKQRVISPQFSPDNKKIYTACLDSTCKIWDAISGKLLRNFNTRTRFSFISISPNSNKIVIWSSDSTAKIWNPETGELIAELRGHASTIYRVLFSPDGNKILTYSQDNSLKTWNAENGKILINLKEPGVIIYAEFYPDGKKIIVSYVERVTDIIKIKILDAENGNLLSDLTQPGASFAPSIRFCNDGKRLLVPMEDGTIKVFDMNSGKVLMDLTGLKWPVVAVNVSPDQRKIIAGSGDGKIKIWDMETGTVLAEMKDHVFTIRSVVYSPDGKKIISVAWDYTAKVWDAESYNLLYTFIAVGKDEYLFLDKNNHYDGTEKARKLLYFTCGTEVIELEQVKDQLWVPNLTERILSGESINAAKLSDLNICNLTPLVDTVDQTALQYRFRITARIGGLGATIVYVNGIEVKRYTPLQLTRHAGNYQLAIDKKELQKLFIPGKENNIVVKSLTAKTSISSRSVSITERGKEINAALPNLFAVIVGVSDYKGEELDLKYAAKDAVDMASAIDASAKKLLNTDGKEHVFIYKIHTGTGRDKFPEKNSIRQVFSEIAGKAGPNDILLVFFAGHGVMESAKDRFYFLTADASTATVSGALKEVGISTEELTDWIRPQVMRAQKRILIFDACNSGQVIKDMISFGPKGQNMLATRGDDKGKQIKAIEKLNERSGMFILSASASDQKAYEMGKYNQGTLTYSLLKAIKEQPDILEDRKYLNISRWFNAAEKSVGDLARETGAKQQPQLVSTTNFNIGVVDEEVRNLIVLPFEKPLFTRSEFRNVDLRIDNLRLRAMVDKRLEEISEGGSNASILFSPEYEGVNVYAIGGDYTVKGETVNVSVILTKGGTEIKTKFEITGSSNDPEGLSRQIIASAMEWLKKNK